MSTKEYLNVKYADKEEAKTLGARWDPSVKKWYIPENCPNTRVLSDKWGSGEQSGSTGSKSGSKAKGKSPVKAAAAEPVEPYDPLSLYYGDDSFQPVLNDDGDIDDECGGEITFTEDE